MLLIACIYGVKSEKNCNWHHLESIEHRPVIADSAGEFTPCLRKGFDAVDIVFLEGPSNLKAKNFTVRYVTFPEFPTAK